MINKCNYCNFTYKESKVYIKHLNEKHIKCLCGKVFNKDDSLETLALCKKCKEDQSDK
jgi:hypothetical protein